jgi:hypothetical protein
MIRTPSSPSPLASVTIRARVKIAGAASAGLFALLALGQMYGAEPLSPPAPALAPRIASDEAPAALRSYSYYPEQLAALHSLSNFQPIADAGEKPATQVAPSVVAAKAAATDVKLVRRPDSAVKIAVAPPAPVLAAPQAAPSVPDQPTKVFGLPLPGAPDIGGRVAGMRDTAANWGKAVAGFGGKIVSFWR